METDASTATSKDVCEWLENELDNLPNHPTDRVIGNFTQKSNKVLQTLFHVLARNTLDRFYGFTVVAHTTAHVHAESPDVVYDEINSNLNGGDLEVTVASTPREIDEPDEELLVEGWYFDADEDYPLYECDVVGVGRFYTWASEQPMLIQLTPQDIYTGDFPRCMIGDYWGADPAVAEPSEIVITKSEARRRLEVASDGSLSNVSDAISGSDGDDDDNSAAFKLPESWEEPIKVTITRDMYEELRDSGYYHGEDRHGHEVRLSEDFQTVGKSKSEGPGDPTWKPLFPVTDDSDIDTTETVASHDSKSTLLEAMPDDLIQVTKVHEGMRNIPEKYRVIRRTNTYYGPTLRLKPHDWDGTEHVYELTCPDHRSRLVLWRAVTDEEGFVQSWSKVAKVSTEIFNVAQYDICEGCGEPIKTPMHRSLALMGQCNGQFDH